MKRPVIKLSLTVLSLALLTTACHKDDEDNTFKPEFPTTYSSLTSEQNKQNLEDNGVKFADAASDIKNTTGIQASMAFEAHVNNSDNSKIITDGRQNNTQLISNLAALGSGKSSPRQFLENLKTDDSSFDFDSKVGVYVFNATDNTWSYTKSGDKIVFKFPATKDGTNNNAEIDIYDYKSVIITTDGVTDDYPTSLKEELFVDGAKKMSFNLTATYDSKGDPTAASISYTLDDYTFKFAGVNTTSNASADYSLSKGTTLLISFGVSASGNLTDDESTTTVNEASAYFQVENVKFSARINYKALTEGEAAAKTDEAKLKLINDNYKLLVFYADSKQKIADTKFDIVPATDNLPAHLDVFLVFADKSQVLASTYFDAGFESFKDKVDALVKG